MKNTLPRISIIFLAVLCCCYVEAATRKLKANTRCASTVAHSSKPATPQAKFRGREPFLARYAPYSETHVSMSETSATVRLRDLLPVMHKRAIGDSDNSNDLEDIVFRESMVYRILNPKNDVRFLARQFGIVHFSDKSSVLEIERIEGDNLLNVFHQTMSSKSINYIERIEDFLGLLKGMALVLNSFHLSDALHLDPKPENFILSSEGRLVAIDLSLVVIRWHEHLSKPLLYATFAAPEQTNYALGGVSHKTDFFMLMKNMDELFLKFLDPKGLNYAPEKAMLYDWVYARLVTAFTEYYPKDRPESLLSEIDTVLAHVSKFRGSEIYK